VCIFYDLHIDQPVECVPIAEWYHVEGERITSIRTILDTAPFMSSAPATTATAVDPVCGMTVAIAAAPATRTYAGQTYAFCNPACAEAFDARPQRYVAAA
jgi:YHS domain-containing protein